MAFLRIRRRIGSIIEEYPRHFWTIIITTFIDQLGGALLFPFFTLYITKKFGVGMTTVGVLFAIFSITGFIGSTIGGALTDRFGRKVMVLFGLITSALSTLWMGLANDLELFFLGAVFVGLLSNMGGPARQAMVADILPEQQRAQGFGILRVTANLSVTIGPAIGGFLASRSYFMLFVADVIASLSVAVVLFLILPETRPRWPSSKPTESFALTFAGYGQVIRDRIFMIFLFASTLMTIVYVQMNSTLAVYLRDVHGIDERGFGFIMTLNAFMVVAFQFSITRRIVSFPPMAVMAAGTAFYAIGFAMYGWVSDYFSFQFAMVVITIGEMLVAPVAQALVAKMAPEDMRGRYMAVYGYSWTIAFAVGPLSAGMIMDQINPIWVWYAAGIVGLAATSIFIHLHRQTEQRGEISAQAS